MARAEITNAMTHNIVISSATTMRSRAPEMLRCAVIKNCLTSLDCIIVPGCNLTGSLARLNIYTIRAWRTAGRIRGRLAGARHREPRGCLFTGDTTYLQSPYEQPITGLDEIERMWEEETEGLTRSSPWPQTSLPSTVRRRWSAPRSAMEIRRARSTATCGFSGSLVTAAAPGSKSGPYWPGRPRSARDDLA